MGRRTFAYGAATSQGSWHVQEDGFFADPGRGVFALADGFGGRGAGDIAVKQALQEVRSHSPGDRSPRESGILSPAQGAHRDLFGEINLKLFQWNEKRAAGARGGCSLLLATVEKENQIAVTSCGACSAFLLRAGVWIPVLTAQGGPRQVSGGPLFPSQALGIGRELNPESRSLSWQSGDLLLLFSSGLSWERDGFASELAAQLALREPGSDLGAIVTFATEGTADTPALLNQTAVIVEALL